MRHERQKRLTRWLERDWVKNMVEESETRSAVRWSSSESYADTSNYIIPFTGVPSSRSWFASCGFKDFQLAVFWALACFQFKSDMMHNMLIVSAWCFYGCGRTTLFFSWTAVRNILFACVYIKRWRCLNRGAAEQVRADVCTPLLCQSHIFSNIVQESYNIGASGHLHATEPIRIDTSLWKTAVGCYSCL